MEKPKQSSAKPQVTKEKYPTGKPQVKEEKYSSTGKPQVTEEKYSSTGKQQVTEEKYAPTGKQQVTEENYSELTKQPSYAVYASDDAGNDISRTAPDMAFHIALSDTFDINKPIFGYLRPKRNCEHIRITLQRMEAELAKIPRFELGPGGKPIRNEEWLELNDLIQRTRVSLRQCEENPLTDEPIYVHVVLSPRKPWPRSITLSFGNMASDLEPGLYQ